MVYRFAQERQDYQDFASGSVFYGLPGHPAFPIRLTSEIFQRCMDIRHRAGQNGRCNVYDPCCGGGYLLVTLAFLHGADLHTIYGSDVEPQALEVAARNLNLLSLDGLNQRLDQIESMIRQFDKPSHKQALESAMRLKTRLVQLQSSHSIAAQTFSANVVTNTLKDYLTEPVDLVITDIPYGNRSSWVGLPEDASHEPAWYMLQSLRDILSDHALVAVTSNKQQKITHDQYQRVEHFQIGKRKVTILRPLD